MVESRIELKIANQRVLLLPQRVVFVPNEEALLVSDLHWGKSEIFHQHGLPVPTAMIDEDLKRLESAILETKAKVIYALGDLIHGPAGITDDLNTKIGMWFQKMRIPMILIRGNHERRLVELPPSWHIEITEESVSIGMFELCHHPESIQGRYVWSGHLHPTVTIRKGKDTLRFPCFFIRENMGILPAFSSFSRGPSLKRHKTDRVFAIVEHSIVEV